MRIKLNNAFIAASLIFAISVSSENLIPNIKSTKSNDIKSVMFVGHSFFYYNNSLHNHLGKLIKADPEIGDIKRRSITINGPIDRNWAPFDITYFRISFNQFSKVVM